MIRTLAAALAASSCIVALATPAAAQTREYNIPAGSLKDALDTYVRQSGRQIVYRTDQVRSARSPGVRGSFSADAALAALLKGSGYKPRVDGSLIAIVKSGYGNVNDVAQPGDSPTGGSADKSIGRGRGTEIVVTAQRREEQLKDVPISISVLGGQQLDQSSGQGVSEALSKVAGVYAGAINQTGGSQISIRGVGASGPLFNGASPIAYYLDSVPFGLIKNAIAPDSSAYDLQRVEVLRGPQGTLYGAAAQNGVVRVLTNPATLGEIEFKARGQMSTTRDGAENLRADAALNLPLISDAVALRAVAGYASYSGWIDNSTRPNANDAELKNFRGRLDAAPTPNLDISLTSWISRSDFGAPFSSSEDRAVAGSLPEPQSSDFDAFGASISYDFGPFTVSSATSYLDYRTDGKSDLTPFGLSGFRGETLVEAEVFSQEVNFNSTASTGFIWSGGLFYRDAEERLFQDVKGLLPAPLDDTDTSKSYAVYGEVGHTFFDDKLEVTAGLRYFHDKVTTLENVQGIIRQKATFDAWTPRVTMTYSFDDRLHVYGVYSQGFRSGFPQKASVTQVAPNIPPVAPDRLHNFEIGFRGETLDGNLIFDTSAYYIKWNDVQQSLVLALPGSGLGIAAVVNGEAASGFGIDASITVRPAIGLEFGASGSWNNLTLDGPVLSSFGTVLFNKGDRLNYSPEFTVSTFLDYTFGLSSTLDATLSLSANYASEQISRGELGPTTFVLEGDDEIVGRASLRVGAPDDKWSVMVFADNITDADPTVPPTTPFPDWTPRIRPRTIGLQFDVNFR